MKIVVKTNDQVVFDDIAEGTIFRIDYEGSQYNQPTYAMKISAICDRYNEESVNAVDMHNGSLFWVDGYNPVTVFDNARLVIE